VTITVERDRRVVVHAPESMSDEKIRQVVESKRQWIYEKTNHPQKYRSLPHPPGKELVSGESVLYLGRQYRIEIVETGLTEIQFAQRFLIPASKDSKRVETLREWYVRKAKEKIVPRVKQHARQLGVEVGEVRIVDNRYRWGSCTPNSNVNLNWRLIKAPMFVIDYVIIHELAHLIEANHTPRFWNIIRAQTPTMDKAKAWLREYGQLLEQAI
jgi:predicted metal-dependent hydrolase